MSVASVVAAAGPDTALDAAADELAAALGRLPRASELALLVRRLDGSVAVTIHEPTLSALGEHVDRPWVSDLGLACRSRQVTIAEAAAVLLDPTSGHAEVTRRQELWRLEQQRREQQERQWRADRAREAAEERARQQRERQAYEEHGGEDWQRMCLEAKVLFFVALAVEDGGNVAAALRRAGAEVAKSGTISFPGRRWR